MSAPPSPHIGQTTHSKHPHKSRGRPPALDFPDHEIKAASDGDVRYERADNGGLLTNRTAYPVCTLI